MARAIWGRGACMLALVVCAAARAQDPAALAQEAERAGNTREAVRQYALVLQASKPYTPEEREIVSKIVALAATLDPKPARSEEAERHFVRGNVLAKEAKNANDYNSAMWELWQAIRAAPWWADPYVNFALVAEQARQPSPAVVTLRWYLVLNPNAPDAAAVRQKSYALEVAAENEVKQRAFNARWNGNWAVGPLTLVNSRTLNGNTTRETSQGPVFALQIGTLDDELAAAAGSTLVLRLGGIKELWLAEAVDENRIRFVAPPGWKINENDPQAIGAGAVEVTRNDGQWLFNVRFGSSKHAYDKTSNGTPFEYTLELEYSYNGAAPRTSPEGATLQIHKTMAQCSPGRCTAFQ